MRRTALLLVFVAACRGAATEPGRDTCTPLFDRVWADFDAHYAFFELGHIDWNALRTAYRDSVARATSDAVAARLIGAMIGRLHDYHADVTTPYGTFGAPPLAYAHHFSPDVVRSSYLADSMRPTASGRISYARLRGGVGYVYIGSFEGRGWGADVEQALAELGGVAGLVIDVRDNGGGNEDNAIDVAARLFDRPRVYRVTRVRNGPGHGDLTAPSAASLAPAGVRRFGGPVALVTNRYVGSAAEDFTLMVRALPNAVTVGDTTIGAGSDPLRLRLDNGWTYRVPQSIQSTPDGFVYQWRGLPPGIAVAWDADAGAERKDPYLDAAITALATLRPSP